LLELGAACGSKLKLARFRGAGSFKPRNDGPLMPLTLRGASSETGAEVCGAEGLCGCEVEGIADDRGAV
jgi:hypothetical protein